MTLPQIVPIECKFGPTSAYAYYIAGDEPAIIDTGVDISASKEITTVLAEAGYRIEDIRWIILTHGHVDHLGGAHAVWEKTNRQANIVMPQAEAYLLKDRQKHLEDYEALQGTFMSEEIQAKHKEMLLQDIGDSMTPTHEVVDGDVLHIGEHTLRVIETPGHSIGSVTYLLEGAHYAFAADAVQMYGGAKSAIPTIEYPALYRQSIQRLIDLQPARLYLGHYFRDQYGKVFDAQIDGEDVLHVLEDSLKRDSEIRQKIVDHLLYKNNKKSVYGEFQGVAEALNYTADPTFLPCAFFVTMHGYQKELQLSAGGRKS